MRNSMYHPQACYGLDDGRPNNGPNGNGERGLVSLKLDDCSLLAAPISAVALTLMIEYPDVLAPPPSHSSTVTPPPPQCSPPPPPTDRGMYGVYVVCAAAIVSGGRSFPPPPNMLPSPAYESIGDGQCGQGMPAGSTGTWQGCNEGWGWALHVPGQELPVKAPSGMGAAADKEREREREKERDGPSATLLDKVGALDALLRVGALRTLDLKGNDLRMGITYIAQVLKRNQTLKVLNLAENKLNVTFLVSLAEAIVRLSLVLLLDVIINNQGHRNTIRAWRRTLTRELGNTIQTTEDPLRMEELLGVNDELTALVTPAPALGRPTLMLQGLGFKWTPGAPLASPALEDGSIKKVCLGDHVFR
ncbi:hypothetical protein DFH07DRAFT_984076 [Mycena maculata]|uniref:Uncharacterized protein n=1 Tax=Mycena maculata TaxID=230809 RepID=A0AAD7N0E1_9AGAR|nr:hypothetical protein DFH07DRAFT_984076 [Mycena maculata]